MNKQTVEKLEQQARLIESIHDAIQKDPDFYPHIINAAATAWSDYRQGFTEKEAGLELILYKLLTKKKAQEFIDNRKTPGWPNLDMYPRLEETLNNITNNSQ